MGRGAAGPQVGKIAHEYDSVEKIAPVLQGLGELASAILRHGWAAPASHTTVVAALHARPVDRHEFRGRRDDRPAFHD